MSSIGGCTLQYEDVFLLLFIGKLAETFPLSFAITDLNQFFYFHFFLPSPLTRGKFQGIRISKAEELSD